jgi:hypothetical protein
MKITGQVEQLFAYAVALDQSGGLKNTIYAIGKEIYIINYDHTVLLRFRLRDTEKLFDVPISFKADDYDSNEFYEEDGKIVFVSNNQGYEKKKVCGKAETKPEEIKELMSGYIKEKSNRNEIIINNSVLNLLDQDLSHIEFSGKKGKSLKMIQRNIYSGGIIEVSETNKGFFKNTLENDFGPIGIKTNDFKALFTFQDSLKFFFPSEENEDYLIIQSLDKNKRDMTGIVACCLYDELIQIKQLRRRK